MIESAWVLCIGCGDEEDTVVVLHCSAVEIIPGVIDGGVGLDVLVGVSIELVDPSGAGVGSDEVALAGDIKAVPISAERDPEIRAIDRGMVRDLERDVVRLCGRGWIDTRDRDDCD